MLDLPKARELRELDKTGLQEKLDGLKQELAGLRVRKVAGATGAKLARIRHVRKAIARVLTIAHENQRKGLVEFYRKKKYVPLDLRPKMTRAIRRRLTKDEASRMTRRQTIRLMAFPQRRFGIRT